MCTSLQASISLREHSRNAVKPIAKLPHPQSRLMTHSGEKSLTVTPANISKTL